jgi:hypothetical protein
MYTALRRRNDARLKEILVANTTGAMYTHESFTYKGVYYSTEQTQPRFKTNRLLPELQPAMDAFLADKKNVEYNEQPYIFGFFRRMLNVTSSIDDYLLILPECMHSALGPQRSQAWVDANGHFPREMTDEQIEAFKLDNQDWILKLKKRMILDLITV